MIRAIPAGEAALLINGRSRRGAAAYEPALRAMAHAGVDVTYSTLVHDLESMRAAVADVIARGCSLLVVGGGDGTVGTVAGLLADLPVDRRPVLGVLPLGTANDFARTLDLPADLTAAVAVLAGGKVVDIDLGRANGLPFLNVASLGLSVEATLALRPAVKRRLGSLAYPISSMVAYRRHRPFRPGWSSPTPSTRHSNSVTCFRWRSAMGGTTAAAIPWRRTPASTIPPSTSMPSRPAGYATI